MKTVFVTAKVRVAPTKQLPISRLELQVAVYMQVQPLATASVQLLASTEHMNGYTY